MQNFEGDYFYEQYTFKDLTLKEWSQKLSLLNKSDTNFNKISVEQLQMISSKMIEFIEIVMENYGISKSVYELYKDNYEKELKEYTQNFRTSGSTSINVAKNLAVKQLEELNNTLAFYKVLYDFWQLQYEKIKLIEQKLNSLSYLYNKYG